MQPRPGSFDTWAHNYDTALSHGLSISGEDREYFARGRIAWLASRLGQLGVRPGSVLDFGCGTGTGAPVLAELLEASLVVGVDASTKSVEAAARRYGSARFRFLAIDQYQPNGEIDLAYCNGVFHHISVQERPDVVRYVLRALRPGGLFAFWENNPWNPGTQLVMRRIAFDRDAVTLSAPQAQRLLSEGGFEIVHTDFLFIFPRLLRLLRLCEPWLSRWPLGAQYQVLCRKRL